QEHGPAGASERVLEQGGEVLCALPTAQFAARSRAKLPERLPEQETVHALHGIDLIVVDKVQQLGAADFERILRLWQHAERLPALILLGDKYQLPGVAPVATVEVHRMAAAMPRSWRSYELCVSANHRSNFSVTCAEVARRGLAKSRPLLSCESTWRIEVNPENYKAGKLNIRKKDDYVNGMLCHVEVWSAISGALRVRTKTNKRLYITPWTDVERGNVVYYRGAHYTLQSGWTPRTCRRWLTQLSRVEKSNAYSLAGKLTPDQACQSFS
ncbi:unnamed protein product, partial [Effrenium voratum]